MPTNMEKLLQMPGSELPEISVATFNLFIPLLLRNPAIQNALSPQTHHYGPLASQELDIYHPPPGTPLPGNCLKPPVLVFYYGGGYVVGRKQMPLTIDDKTHIYPASLRTTLHSSPETLHSMSDPLVDKLYHQNIGTFVASHGYITVIPDYRLVPMTSVSSPYNPSIESNEAIFPSGAEDVCLSLKWIADNLNEIADTSSIYAMGHSAGANHLISAFLLPSFLPAHPDLLSSVKNVITISATFSYIHSRESRRIVWSRYFGDFAMIPERCPLGLLQKLDDREVAELPELICLHAERDHEGAKIPQGEFWDAWKTKGGRGIMHVVSGTGHNHMSTIYGIGCGDEEVEGWLAKLLDSFPS